MVSWIKLSTKGLSFYLFWSCEAVVLNSKRSFFPQEDIWQCLERFLIAMTCGGEGRDNMVGMVQVCWLESHSCKFMSTWKVQMWYYGKQDLWRCNWVSRRLHWIRLGSVPMIGVLIRRGKLGGGDTDRGKTAMGWWRQRLELHCHKSS